jgi:hypothetical protein
VGERDDDNSTADGAGGRNSQLDDGAVFEGIGLNVDLGIRPSTSIIEVKAREIHTCHICTNLLGKMVA